MIRAGFDLKEAHHIWTNMNRGQSVLRRPVRLMINLDLFRKRGSVFLHDYTIALFRA